MLIMDAPIPKYDRITADASRTNRPSAPPSSHGTQPAMHDSMPRGRFRPLPLAALLVLSACFAAAVVACGESAGDASSSQPTGEDAAGGSASGFPELHLGGSAGFGGDRISTCSSPPEDAAGTPGRIAPLCSR